MDTGFLDPAECYYLYGQPPPSPQKHSGYWADPRVWSLINRVAAGLPSANGSASGSRASVHPIELIQELRNLIRRTGPGDRGAQTDDQRDRDQRAVPG